MGWGLYRVANGRIESGAIRGIGCGADKRDDKVRELGSNKGSEGGGPEEHGQEGESAHHELLPKILLAKV